MKKGTAENQGSVGAACEASRFSGVEEMLETSAGGKGVISMKSTPKIGRVSAINLVDDTTEMMLISQFGKIIRIVGVEVEEFDAGGGAVPRQNSIRPINRKS